MHKERPDNLRRERLTILLTAKEKAVIEREAKRRRQTVSGVVRDAITNPDFLLRDMIDSAKRR